MATFRLEGREYEIPERFTLGEMSDMERYFGVQFGDDMPVGISATAAVLWIAIRRVDPTVTLEDIRGMDMEVLGELGAEVAAASPPALGTSDGTASSGDGSELPAENLANGPSPTGVPV